MNLNKFKVFKQVPKLLFGKGSIDRLEELLPTINHKRDYYIFVIDKVLRKEKFISNFEKEFHQIIWFDASLNEPKTNQIDAICSKISLNPIAIVGIGGGSTLDVAKSISIMLNNPGSCEDYQGWDLVRNPSIYKIGIPSISGSGAEASRTAVLTSEVKKQGINSDHSMFDAIILDSNLTLTVPVEQHFFTAMDCFIHCVESIEGTMINEISKGFADKALDLCLEVFTDEFDADKLMVASYFGGVSIVNSEVGICHALSYGLSMEYNLRHGLANCIVFNMLSNYYPKHVEIFKKLLKKFKIVLPENVCTNINEETLNRMVDTTYRMEKPLINALGHNFKDILTPDKIKALYKLM